MQLDAFLSSLRVHVGAAYAPVVLFRASNRRFAAGYAAVRAEYSDVEWLEETDFRRDLLSSLDTSGLLVFHTDDDVFFGGLAPFELADDEICFSLRLGLNVRYSYSLDRPERLRGPSVREERVSWNWRVQDVGSFSYPLALNGHVFRSAEARGLIEAVDFSNPNELESQLHARDGLSRPRMASFIHSRVVSIPANIVTSTFRNRHGGLETAAELNERFLAGERIDPAGMAFDHVASCHEEIPFAYRRVD